MNKASVIRPGLLVSVKSSLVGGVSYQRIDLDVDTGANANAGTDAADVARWETIRTIEDPAEHERATKARAKALSMIRKECSTTAFGLLCPVDNEGALDAAIVAARKIADEHNSEATHTQIGIFVLKGRVASDDAEAARAITSEIAGLVVAMDRGISALDSSAIREAANKARDMAGMLGEAAKASVDKAIVQARAAARMIVKRIEKDGEAAAIVLADIQRGQIESARITFLDLEVRADDAVHAAAMPSVQVQRFADVAAEGS